MSCPGKSSLWVLAAVLLALLPACGGGGGGGDGGGGGPTTPGPSVTFTPAGVTGARTLTLHQAPDSSADRLVLELRAESVEDLYAISFDLRYPASSLSFEALSEEGFLSADGTATSLQVAEGPAGNLVVGLSRLGQIGGVSGSGTLLRFELRPLASGTGSLAFDGQQAFGPQGEPRPSVRWGAGTVQVVR